MRTRLFVAAAALSLLSISGLIAQNRGTITGTVVDDQGTPLPGVAVELTGPDTRKTVSDARGRFSFGLLAPGAYQIRFRLAGFNDVVQAATVQAGATARLTARMAVASLQESVTVTGEAPRVDHAGQQGRAGYRGRARGPTTATNVVRRAGGDRRRRREALLSGCARQEPQRRSVQYRSLRLHRREPVPARRRRSAVNLLDRRRHRVVRQRPPLPQRWIAAAGWRGADRRADQLLPLHVSAAGGQRAVLGHDRADRLPVESQAQAGADRAAGP